MKNILTVGCEIPGGLGECVEFNSKTSLLDADFVLFCPDFGYYHSSQEYKGKPRLSDSSSFRLQEVINHWRRELNYFLKIGKTVFMIMSDRKKVYVNTGGEEDSGIDLISTTTNRVCPLSNYDLLPFSTKIVESKGGSMRLHPGEDLLRGYWQQFGNEIEYHVHMEESDSFRPVVVTRHGGRIVGGIFRYKNGGALVALPWINFDREEFYDEGQRAEDDDVDEEWTWTPKAIGWGKNI